MQNIVVTGASGFIGTNFIKEAQEFNITTVSLQKTVIEKINFSNIDVVLHLAALVHQMKGAPEEDYFKVNYQLTIDLANFAKQHGVKQFIFMSTAKVFGESSLPNYSFNEDSACKPEDAYGKSKLKAEIELMKLNCPTFIVSILRTPLVYGVGVKANMKNLINLVKKIPILPFGKINNSRSMVFTGNLNALIKKIIERNLSGIFHATDPTSISTSDIVKYIADSLNKKIILLPIPYFLIKYLTLIKPEFIHRLYSSFEMSHDKTNKILNHRIPFSTKQGFEIMIKNFSNQ